MSEEGAWTSKEREKDDERQTKQTKTRAEET